MTALIDKRAAPGGTAPVIDAPPWNSHEVRGLYQAREAIHPSRVEGKFRRLKWGLVALFLSIYWLTPWIRWDRGPGAPDQTVLVDLANRRFFIGIESWPQEFFYKVLRT